MTAVGVGLAETFVDGHGRCVDVGDMKVAVFRDGDTLFALADRCSHAEASLSEGEVFDGEVECPRHGALFDLATGAALTLPATKPVRAFATEVVDGEVLVRIDEGVGNE